MAYLQGNADVAQLVERRLPKPRRTFVVPVEILGLRLVFAGDVQGFPRLDAVVSVDGGFWSSSCSAGVVASGGQG